MRLKKNLRIFRWTDERVQTAASLISNDISFRAQN